MLLVDALSDRAHAWRMAFLARGAPCTVVTLHLSTVLVCVFALRAHSQSPATFVKRENRALDK